MPERYYFQNPNTGWPMVLTQLSDGSSYVYVEEGHTVSAHPTDEDCEDARKYTKAVSNLEPYDAALTLLRDFNCKDIFS